LLLFHYWLSPETFGYTLISKCSRNRCDSPVPGKLD